MVSTGCVRLWDVGAYSEFGGGHKIIGQTDSYVGDFIIGDLSKGEKNLIMYVYLIFYVDVWLNIGAVAMAVGMW